MGIEDEVRENRQETRRVQQTFRETPPQQTLLLAFADVTITVDVEARVYTRSLNDTLVFGHPDASQGFGRGTFGDSRGSWTQQATASASESTLVAGGRNAVAEALAGVAQGVEFARVGSDGTDPSVGDTALGSGGDVVDAWGVQGTTTTTGVATFRFAEVTDTVAEVGVHDAEQDLMARATLTAVDPSSTQEVKIEVDLTFGEATLGSNAVTGLDTIADAIASEANGIGIAEIALGTDGTDPMTGDASLGTEVVRRETRPAVDQASTSATALFLRDEPSTQPHDIREAGVFDDNGTMLWRLTFDAREKDDLIQMKAITGAEVQ